MVTEIQEERFCSWFRPALHCASYKQSSGISRSNEGRRDMDNIGTEKNQTSSSIIKLITSCAVQEGKTVSFKVKEDAPVSQRVTTNLK